MISSRWLRKHFHWLLPPPVLLVVLLCVQGIAALAGANLGLDARRLALDATLAFARRPGAPPPFHTTSARAILDRNPFDSTVLAAASDPPVVEDPAWASDPAHAPPCDDVRVLGIVSSGDAAWSFAAFAPADPGAAPRTVLRRRGGEVGASQVALIAWDRVWMSGPKGLCQAALFGPGPEIAPPPAAGAHDARPAGRLPAESGGFMALEGDRRGLADGARHRPRAHSPDPRAASGAPRHRAGGPRERGWKGGRAPPDGS